MTTSTQQWPHWLDRARTFGPGFVTALTVAAAANFVAAAYGGPVMLLALLIGMTLNFLSDNEAAAPGLDLAAKPILKIGVALLGLRISYAQVAGLGLETLLLVTVGVIAAIGAGVAIARFGKQDLAFGLLAGGATGICGASAALAISSVMPKTEKRDQETAYVVVAVTMLSTVAMVMYPILARWLGLDAQSTGILLGATIHDVAQVVGSGYAVSTDVGDTATVVKLVRVALLLPTVVIISMFFSKSGAGVACATLPTLPLFAVGFAVLVAVNSMGWVPQAVSGPMETISRWCLVVAIASIGVRTSIVQMLRMGRTSLAIPAGATLVLLILVTGVLLVEKWS